MGIGGGVAEMSQACTAAGLEPLLPSHPDHQSDSQYRERFQQWINQLWQHKDQQLTALKQGEKQ